MNDMTRRAVGLKRKTGNFECIPHCVILYNVVSLVCIIIIVLSFTLAACEALFNRLQSTRLYAAIFLLVNVAGYLMLVDKTDSNDTDAIFMKLLVVLALIVAEAMAFFTYIFRGHLVPYITPKLQNKAKLFISFYQVVCIQFVFGSCLKHHCRSSLVFKKHDNLFLCFN